MEHKPVLLEPLQNLIKLPPSGVMVDATIGFGGHAKVLAAGLENDGTLIGIDVDLTCLETAQKNLSDLKCRVIFERANFADIGLIMHKYGLEKADLILADLGLCSGQLIDDKKGLSFQKDMPLDMRLDDRLQLTAADIVNKTGEQELADIIFKYGQDRASRRIARFIVRARAARAILSTMQLADIVCRAVGQPARGRAGKIHPATRTFQALRIAVNNESGNLERLLSQSPGLLRPGGLIAVISFHSLEDAAVKENFRQNKSNGIYEILTKKPIEAGFPEAADNPRARSAKLRIARKL